LNQGEFTGKLGKKIQETYSDRPGIQVFYDHLSPKDSYTCAPTPHWGELHNDTSLSEVDIAILQDGQVRILCEVEENALNPKEFLGDVYNLFLAEHISIKCETFNKDLPLEDYFFILAVRVPEKGNIQEKYGQLETRLRSIVRDTHLHNKKLIFIYDSDLDGLKEKVLEKIEELLPEMPAP